LSDNELRVDSDSAAGAATALRRAFDRSFAVAASLQAQRLEQILAIRVGSDPYALRVSEIAGLHVDVEIVPVPGPVPQLLGIVGLRGTLLPVYDLAALLRHLPASRPRWLVLMRMPQPVGFAFDTFEAHLQMPDATIADGAGEAPPTAFLRGMVRAAGALRPIIHLTSLVESIKDKNS